VKDLDEPIESTEEQKLLKALFILLRAGKHQEAQALLLQSSNLDKFLWLCGAIPQFDNICYAEVLE